MLKLSFSPDGDFIAFNAEQTMTAPAMYIAYDPVSDSDPSIIFAVSGVILDPGETRLADAGPGPRTRLLRRQRRARSAVRRNHDLRLARWRYARLHRIDRCPRRFHFGFHRLWRLDGLSSPSKYINDILQNPLVNHRLKLTSSTGTYDCTPRANAPAGVYHVDATFANVTEVSLADVYFKVANLGAGNVVLNAVGGPAGVGAEIAVPPAVLGADGLLGPNESFTLGFDVGLASVGSSNLTVDANGEPWDWTPNVVPPPAYDANNASFVFTLTPRVVYLPLLVAK